MRLRAIALTLAATLAFAVPASTAFADDRAVYAEWNKDDARGTTLVNRIHSEIKRYNRSRGRRWRPVYRAAKRYVRFNAAKRRAITALTASTPDGEEVRTLAIKALRTSEMGNTSFAREIRLLARRRERAADRALDRAEELTAKAAKLRKQVIRGFRELGFG